MIEMKEFARGLGYTIIEKDWIDHRKFSVRYPNSSFYSTILDFTYEGCDYVNLGFSGNARAEDAMANYIKKLDMSLFVYDYDHNAPTVTYLKDTHEKMFKKVRKENPDLPIIMMSRPKYILGKYDKMRLEVIKETYNNARSAGDENVYLISGQELVSLCKNEGTVDDCHPTDLGFFSIAQVLGDAVEKILFPKS